MHVSRLQNKVDLKTGREKMVPHEVLSAVARGPTPTRIAPAEVLTPGPVASAYLRPAGACA